MDIIAGASLDAEGALFGELAELVGAESAGAVQAMLKPILRTSGGDEPRRLWRDKERTEEARELLAPVYGQFTEGFETTDLKAAKPLVD